MEIVITTLVTRAKTNKRHRAEPMKPELQRGEHTLEDDSQTEGASELNKRLQWVS